MCCEPALFATLTQDPAAGGDQMSSLARIEKRSRRSWQFSLRFLVILTLVVAAYFGGWISNEWKHRAEIERAANESAELERAANEPRIAAMRRRGFVQAFRKNAKQLEPFVDEGPLLSLPTPEYWEELKKRRR